MIRPGLGSLVLLALVACSMGDASGVDIPWTAEEVRRGDTLVVRTVAGSVWRDTAELLPEAALAEILAGPVFTPHTVAPRVLNRDEVLRAREREVPTHLEAAEVGGTVTIWFLIDDEGQVLRRLIHESSENAELDAAALRVAQVFRFSPALNDGQPVYVWVNLPIRFGPS